MATGTIIVIVIVVVVLAAIAMVAVTLLLRRRALRHRFGAEYDQLASEVGERRAQTELIERRRRVEKLDIRPLGAKRRAAYSREWMSVQERFIDAPAQAVDAAAGLVSAVAADRGYPADDEDQLLGDLSVHHANRLDGYRRARQAAGQAAAAGTEELRQALLGFRALFRDLIGPDPAAGAAEPAASGGSQPAAAIARATGARDDATAGETTAGGGRDDRAAASATREE